MLAVSHADSFRRRAVQRHALRAVQRHALEEKCDEHTTAHTSSR